MAEPSALCLCRGICLWRWWMCSLEQIWFPADNQAWKEVATELGCDWQCKIKSQEQKWDVFTHPDSSLICPLTLSITVCVSLDHFSSFLCAELCCSKHLPWRCYLCPICMQFEPNLLLSRWASGYFSWRSPGRDPHCLWGSGKLAGAAEGDSANLCCPSFEEWHQTRLPVPWSPGLWLSAWSYLPDSGVTLCLSNRQSCPSS